MNEQDNMLRQRKTASTRTHVMNLPTYYCTLYEMAPILLPEASVAFSSRRINNSELKKEPALLLQLHN